MSGGKRPEGAVLGNSSQEDRSRSPRRASIDSPRRPIPEERDEDDEGKRDCSDENCFFVLFGHKKLTTKTRRRVFVIARSEAPKGQVTKQSESLKERLLRPDEQRRDSQ